MFIYFLSKPWIFLFMNTNLKYFSRQLGAAIAVLWIGIANVVVAVYPYPDYLPAVMPVPGEVPFIREERFWDWLCDHDDNFEKFLNNNA